MNRTEVVAFAETFLSAWNSQEVERILATYTDDVIYRDPNTRGEVQGADALRRYLSKLLGAWDMQWFLREAYPFADHEGAAVLWHAKLRRTGSEQVVEIDGMDLVLMQGDRIQRNEVWFDRAALGG